MSYFWLHCANLWMLPFSLSMCLSQHHFDYLFSIYGFIFFNLSLLVSSYLWICSTLTFANLPLVWSALNMCFLDPHHMTVTCQHWPHDCIYSCFWSLDSSMPQCVSYNPLYLALCLMLWKEYIKKYKIGFCPLFYLYVILLFIYVLNFQWPTFLLSLVLIVISSFIFL